jgi:hypothetical protein
MQVTNKSGHWLDSSEFQDKRELYLPSRVLDREIAVQDIPLLSNSDLQTLLLEIEAEEAIQRFHREVNLEIEKIDSSHEWKSTYKRFAFKRFVLVFFGKALSREIESRKSPGKLDKHLLVQQEIVDLVKQSLGKGQFLELVSQAEANVNQKLNQP